MLSFILISLTLLSSAQAQSCADKGSLAARFQNIVNYDDANHDNIVTGDELYNNFKNGYDVNQDGCASIKEWTDVWAANNLSMEYALQRLRDMSYTNMSDPICTLNYGFMKGNVNIHVPMSPDFIGGIVASLVTLCRDVGLDSTKVDILKGNCDCAELKDTCYNASVVNGTDACANFRNMDQFGAVCDGKGYIAGRINNVLDQADADGNDVITGLELYNSDKNVDKNNDSCISRQEWSDYLIVTLKFSQEFSAQRLSEIAADVTGPCVINYGDYNTSSISTPRVVFAQRIIQTLVNICTSDADLYRTNCDCAQLKDGCMNDPKMAANVVCKAYINGA